MSTTGNSDPRTWTARGLTIQEACAVAAVSRRTIYNWMEAGKLNWSRNAGGGIRIDPDSLWLDRAPAKKATA